MGIGLEASIRRVHLVGIGGARMSALATLLKQAGLEVTGSDALESATLIKLRKIGVRCDVGHRRSQVAGADLVLYSPAVLLDNVELQAGRDAGVGVITGAEALAKIVSGKRTIAISGTHGKSTTSAMVATVLVEAGLDPTYLIGADLRGAGGGGRAGGSELAIVEADEAYGSFLHLAPAIAVLTNAEVDHLDYYGTADQMRAAFRSFLQAASEKPVVCVDHAEAVEIAIGLPFVGFGFSEGADVRGVDPSFDAGGSRMRLTFEGRDLGELALRVAGKHNAENALAAAAACLVAGVEPAALIDALAGFTGIGRRFEHKGRFDGVDVFDDYAHLPGEVEAILSAARLGPWRRIVAVFQPHLYSRTEDFAAEFGEALSAADIVVVTDVFGAREDPVPGVSGKLIVDAAAEGPGRPRRLAYMPTLDDAAAYVREVVRDDDLVLTLGAGDVTTLGDILLEPAPAR